MTVSELIEELQKHPGHHIIQIVTPCWDEINKPDYFFVSGIECESCVPGPGNTVNIIGEP